jgi:hypothetical protein
MSRESPYDPEESGPENEPYPPGDNQETTWRFWTALSGVLLLVGGAGSIFLIPLEPGVSNAILSGPHVNWPIVWLLIFVAFVGCILIGAASVGNNAGVLRTLGVVFLCAVLFVISAAMYVLMACARERQ